MHYQWVYVFVLVGIIILVAVMRQEFKRKTEKQTDLQKMEARWWELKDDPATRNSEIHRTIGEELDKMLLAELEKALRVMQTTSRLISLGALTADGLNNRRKSKDMLENVFRSWYDHRPKIRKFFDDR